MSSKTYHVVCYVVLSTPERITLYNVLEGWSYFGIQVSDVQKSGRDTCSG